MNQEDGSGNVRLNDRLGVERDLETANITIGELQKMVEHYRHRVESLEDENIVLGQDNNALRCKIHDIQDAVFGALKDA